MKARWLVPSPYLLVCVVQVLHRDLKPQNVFLTGKNMVPPIPSPLTPHPPASALLCGASQVKLGDFGIARVLESTAANAKTQIGTPFYISPEMADGKSYNAPSDMWALGCILFECMTFKPPFKGESIPAILKVHPPSTAPRVLTLVVCE